MEDRIFQCDDFLNRFYAKVRPSESSPGWRDWLRTHGLPIVLPAWVEQKSAAKSTFTVFLIGSDAAEFRELGDQFRAFLGKTYSGTPFTRRAPGANTKFIQDFCGDDCYIAWMTIQSSKKDKAEKALLHWLRVWEQRDQFRASQPTQLANTDRLRDTLRRFQQALAAKDRLAAQGALTDIEDRALLETANRLFLRIQFHAAFREWEAILDNRYLSDLVQIRRPGAVTEALIQAVYYSRLAPHLDDISEMCRVFERDVYPSYRPLYRSRGTLSTPEVVLSFMLRAVALDGDPDPSLRDELLALPATPPAERQVLARLAGYGVDPNGKSNAPLEPPQRPRQRAETLDDIRAAFLNGHDDTALRMIRGAAATEAKVKFLLGFSRQEDTLLSASFALSSLKSLPSATQASLMLVPQIRAEVLRLLARPVPSAIPIQGVAEAASPEAGLSGAPAARYAPFPLDDLPEALPGDWEEWIQEVQRQLLSVPLLLKCAEAGVTEWSVEPLATNVGRANAFAEALDSARDGSSAAFLDALPFIIRAFLEEPGYPRAAFAPVYESLRLTLSYDFSDRGLNGTVIVLFLDLVAGHLSHGVDANAYRGILEEIGDFWEKAGSSNVRSLLDLLDVLLEFPVPDPTCRDRVARRAFTSVSKWISGRRLGEDHERYARRLATEYDLEELLPQALAEQADQPSGTTLWNALNGKRIGLYTLMEGVGNRLRSLLHQLCPGCELLVSSEKYGSNQLRQLAEGTDVFVMVTGCAKHAATEFIERHRPPQKPLLRPAGRGSSSILVSLEEYIRNNGNADAVPVTRSVRRGRR